MFLHRASIIAIALISLGGAVALANPNSFRQTLAQNSAQKQGQPKLMDQLNLNSDQKQKLKVIRDQYKDKISQNKQAVRQANKELRDLMASDASVAQIRAKHDQVQGVRQNLEKVTFESMLETREVLTPEQRIQFAKLMESRQNARNQPNKSAGLQRI